MNIPLFYPFINEAMRAAATEVMQGKIIGEGPKVKAFEDEFSRFSKNSYPLAVNSATSGLDLIYHLLDIGPGDEVITPVFTCTATNIPLLKRGARIVFADVTDRLLLDENDVRRKITSKTKAVINTHLYGVRNPISSLPVPVIGDSAQCMERTWDTYTVYSFQATKYFSTGDGGMILVPREAYNRARILRWYGIDREIDSSNIDTDITEAGYKYHMNDITAAMGIEGLKALPEIKEHRYKLNEEYYTRLRGIDGIRPMGGFGPYLIHAQRRDALKKKLNDNGVEAGLLHKRNDTYTIFGGKKQDLIKMNAYESTYLFLPLHHKVTREDVGKIAEIIKEGW